MSERTKHEIRWITADHIISWATERANAAFTLQGWLKELIHETTKSFVISFPTGKGVYLKGWDGVVECNESTQFVQNGMSFWEIGVQKDVISKLNEDFNSRSIATDVSTQATSTLMLVTPYRCSEKLEWIKCKQSTSHWNKIIVYDAEDLAEWFAIAPRTGLSFGKATYYPDKDYLSAVQWWEERKRGHQEPTRTEIRDKITNLRLQKEKLQQVVGTNVPSILKVKDISIDDALEFICAYIDTCTEEVKSIFFSKALIIESVKAFRVIYQNIQSRILLPTFDITSNGLLQCAVDDNEHIVIMPIKQNFKNDNTTIIDLTEQFTPISKNEILGSKINIQAMQSLQHDETKELIELKSANNRNSDILIPAMLIGKWNEKNENDRLIIEAMSGRSYEEFINKLEIRISENDLPIRKIGTDWLIENPLKLWESHACKIRLEDMRNLHTCFRAIVGERNPALDLPSSERYAASIYGKNYKFTARIKEGVCQSLVFIALYGEEYGVPMSGTHQGWVNNVISNLLLEPEFDIWASLGRTTMLLAEASPEIFLNSVEAIIFSIEKKKKLNDLFIEEPNSFSISSHRTEILWALEQIAWIPQYTSRVCRILIQLPDYDSKGNLSNKSANSLANILCSWCPQTHATLEERILILRALCKHFPEKSWFILLSIIPKYHSVLMPNSKMRWRDRTRTEVHIKQVDISKIVNVAVELIIQCEDLSTKKVSELIDISANLPQRLRKKLLKHLQSIITAESDLDSLLWHKLRDFLNRHRSHPDALWALEERELQPYQIIFDRLKNPASDLQLLWLFDDYHPELSSVEFRTSTYENREILIKAERVNTIQLLLPKRDVRRLFELTNRMRLPHLFVETLADKAEWNNYNSIVEMLSLYLQEPVTNNSTRVLATFIETFYRNQIYTTQELLKIFNQVINNGIKDMQIAHLLSVSNFRSVEIWKYIQFLGKEAEDVYWKNCSVHFSETSSENIEFIIEKLKYQHRNESILLFAHSHRDILPSERIIEVLSIVGHTDSSEPHNLTMMDHYVGELFEVLYKRSDSSNSEIIKLEYLFLPLFSNYGSIKHSKYIQNYLLSSPEFFVDVLKTVYKSEIEDEPEENESQSQENKAAQAEVGYQLLKGAQGIPGKNKTGEIEYDVLLNWVVEVRRLSIQCHRIEVCDMYIGEFFARYTRFDKAPTVDICKIIDLINSGHLNRGFILGIINNRGVVTRGGGGDQERVLVEHYKQYASEIENNYPITASILSDIASNYEEEAKWNDVRDELKHFEG